MSRPEGYTWDQTYLDEYAKGKELLHGRKPDDFVVWASNYLKQKGMNGATILDAGCGEGRNSIYLARQGFRIHGIDIASPAIEKGKQWVKSEGLVEITKLRVGDVTEIPYDDNSFVAVYDSFTMEFIPEKEQYVNEVARVLRPQGLFFILTSIPPSQHNVDPEHLEKMLKPDFEILETDNPSETSLTVVAERR